MSKDKAIKLLGLAFDPNANEHERASAYQRALEVLDKGKLRFSDLIPSTEELDRRAALAEKIEGILKLQDRDYVSRILGLETLNADLRKQINNLTRKVKGADEKLAKETSKLKEQVKGLRSEIATLRPKTPKKPKNNRSTTKPQLKVVAAG